MNPIQTLTKIDRDSLQKEKVSLLEKKTTLVKQQSEVDLELTDLYHFVEFNNVNAREGFKLYKLIQEKRKKRRTIVNETNLATMNINLIDEVISAKFKYDTAKQQQSSRFYTPRILDVHTLIRG